MPFYIVSHYTPLSTAQKDVLAAGITKTHTELFKAPSIFVNINFQDITKSPNCSYVGGDRNETNRITAHVRPGTSRPRSSYDSLCSQISDVWKETISDPEQKLDTIFIMGDILAGYEQGFKLPEAGDDGNWIRENMDEFQQRAKNGEVAMQDMVLEIQRRGLDKI